MPTLFLALSNINEVHIVHLKKQVNTKILTGCAKTFSFINALDVILIFKRTYI